MADTTYLPVIDSFVLLVVIIDLYSRKIVCWSLVDTLDADLSKKDLRKAVALRSPSPGLVFHSDRVIEFTAVKFRVKLDDIGAVQSMSRKGDCWDNASSESFFSTLEFEMAPSTTWGKADDMQNEMFNFIESYYHAKRLHSHNNYSIQNESEFNCRSSTLVT